MGLTLLLLNNMDTADDDADVVDVVVAYTLESVVDVGVREALAASVDDPVVTIVEPE